MVVKLSILIKSYNEEAKIARAIESCFSEIEGLDAEIVLADSCSKDRTVSIAMQYNIRVVQFANSAERSCGAGAQLAFQHSIGEYVYLLDGDMELRPGFIRQGLEFLERNPQVWGVGGIVSEVLSENLEFKHRAERESSAYIGGEVTKLDCGGLYRRANIMKLGYFTDRNLHSYEELDLGARISAAGGRLVRMQIVSVDHYSHTTGSYRHLWRRFSSRYAFGAGEVLKAAAGEAHFFTIVSNLGILVVIAALIVWLAATIAMFSLHEWLVGDLFTIFPVVVMSCRRRSLNSGLFSFASWFVYSFGLVRGLFSTRIDPRVSIKSRILREPLWEDLSSTAC